MKLRTTVFLWVLLLVVVVLGSTIGVIYVVFDRNTRERVAGELERSRAVTLDQHASRAALRQQECHVVAEEPRLKAVVSTEDITKETINDTVRDLATTLRAGVFVLIDDEGYILGDNNDPNAEGSMMGNPVVRDALKNGDQAGVWIDGNKAYQVHGCRQAFGARIVGALVIGHSIDDEFATMIARQTGGVVVVISDQDALSSLPPGIGRGELAPVIEAVRKGAKEVTLGGTHYYAQVAAVPGYMGDHNVQFLLLRSIDEALAPARQIIRILILLLVGAVLAALVLAFGLSRRLSRPIDALVARTHAIAKGDLTARPVGGPTEVRELGAAMNKMAKEIDESRGVLLEKDRLTREMEIAANVQTSILPRNLAVPGLEISAKMIPASEVGGDYYDVVAMKNGCWIAMGDASGHGLTAGLVMMMVQTSLAALVRAQPDAKPREMLKVLNGVLYENIHERLEAERHMTLSLLRYDGAGKFRVAGAHMDAICWRSETQTTEMLPTVGTFLAITDDIDSVTVDLTWHLRSGDLLILLTDGVTEAENSAGKAFGYEGVLEVLEPLATKPVADIQSAVLDAVTRHSPTLADDCTILVLRYVGTGESDG